MEELAQNRLMITVSPIKTLTAHKEAFQPIQTLWRERTGGRRGVCACR